jgi:hypothetical protein
MVPIFVILTVIMCVGIKWLLKGGSGIRTAEEKRMGRFTWELTEEAFLKC